MFADAAQLVLQSAFPILAVKYARPTFLPPDLHREFGAAVWFVVAVCVNRALFRGVRAHGRSWRHLVCLVGTPLAWLLVQTTHCIVREFCNALQGPWTFNRRQKIPSESAMSVLYLIAVYGFTVAYFHRRRQVPPWSSLRFRPLSCTGCIVNQVDVPHTTNGPARKFRQSKPILYASYRGDALYA